MTAPRAARPGAPAPVAALALAVCASLAPGAAPAQSPAPTPVVIESPAVATARLDSLMAIVRAEEARVRPALGSEVNWDRLARAWFQVGDHAKAAKCLERARTVGGREFDTMLLTGRVARTEGRFAEAVGWLERAVRARPGDWEAHEDLGLAYYLDGRLAEAARHWERARALPGSGSPDRGALIAALRRAGDAPYRIGGRGRERLRFLPHPVRGALVVPVVVDGRGPFPFRIDAGSPEVVLGRTLAHELGLADGGAGAGAAAPAPRIDYAVLDSLTLGATTLQSLPIAISDHPALADPSGVRGLLGFEVLRRFRFCIDVADSTLWLEPLPASTTAAAPADTSRPAWLPPGGAAHRVPVLVRGTHLLVAYGRLNQGPERPFLLDTGSPGIAFAAPASTLAEANVALDPARTVAGTTTAGRISYIEYPIARLCLGSACRDSLTGAYGTFPARLELNPTFRLAGVVSSGFLSRYRFAVDLSRGQAWLIEP